MKMRRDEIFQKIAELVGLPKNCTKATIHLDCDRRPEVECKYFVVVERTKGSWHEETAKRTREASELNRDDNSRKTTNADCCVCDVVQGTCYSCLKKERDEAVNAQDKLLKKVASWADRIEQDCTDNLRVKAEMLKEAGK